jgi:predicted small integral membrane protein
MIWGFVAVPLFVAAIAALLAGIWFWAACIFGERAHELISARSTNGLALLAGLLLMASGSGFAYIATKIMLEWH